MNEFPYAEDPMMCAHSFFDGQVRYCTHQAAPRRMFGPAKCILSEDQLRVKSDPRPAPVVCLLYLRKG